MRLPILPALIAALAVLPLSCGRDVLDIERAVVQGSDDGADGKDAGSEPDPEEIASLPVNTGLPVVFINTEGGRQVSSRTSWVPGEIKIVGLGGYRSLPLTGCSVKGRGNSTWGWPKKPYSLVLDEKVSVLGMPPQKHWVLLANYMDRTLMRNALAYHIGRQTSLAWTPSCVFVELVLNGRHVGNYLLSEQVRPDRNRVDIDKENPSSWLFECDFHYADTWQWRNDGIPFCLKFPDEEDVDDETFANAKTYIDEKLKVCRSGDYGKLEEALDLQSFADYWICFEVMGNHELRNPGSVFTHTSCGGRWIAGPIWDFDWGSLSYKANPVAETGLVNRNAVWYGRLFSYKEFRQLLVQRWNSLRGVLDGSIGFIDNTQRLLRESDRLNRAMWDPDGDGNINGDETLSFDDAVSRMKIIFQERIKVIDSIISDGEF